MDLFGISKTDAAKVKRLLAGSVAYIRHEPISAIPPSQTERMFGATSKADKKALLKLITEKGESGAVSEFTKEMEHMFAREIMVQVLSGVAGIPVNEIQKAVADEAVKNLSESTKHDYLVNARKYGMDELVRMLAADFKRRHGIA